MGEGFLLAIDFGTSAVRAVASPNFLNIQNSAREPIHFFKPADGPDASWELDPGEAWQAVCRAIKKCLAGANIGANEIRGIGVTSQRFGLVLLDEHNFPIRICPNRDARAALSAGARAYEACQFLDTLHETRPAMLSAWAKLLWFKEELPDLFKIVHSAVSIADWICLRLTDRVVCELSLAVDASIARFDTGEISEDLLEMFELSHINFPPLCASGNIVGETKGVYAKEAGLSAGIPVTVCGADTQNALLGMGMVKAGDLGVVSGWSMSAQRVLPQPIGFETGHLWFGKHVAPSRWIVEANIGEAGGAYEWFCRLMMGEFSSDALDRLESEASQTAESDGLCVRLSRGHTAMTRLPGLGFGGIIFPIPLSFESPSRGSLARAVLEGFAFVLKDAVAELERVTGKVSSVSFAGGMTRNRLFTRIVANTLGMPVHVEKTAEASALGALAMTSSSMEGIPIEEYAAKLLLQLETVHPDERVTAVFESLYLEWREQTDQLGG